MTYYINPIWFYLMGVSTDLKIILLLAGGLLTVIIGIAWPSCMYFDDWDVRDLYENEIKISKTFKKLLITGIVLIFIGILVPSKETCVEMMIASQITHENVTTTKEEIYEIVDYVTDKVKGEEK